MQGNGKGEAQVFLRPEKDTLVRRLALAKLRELRLAGLSYREIGRRFGAAKGAGVIGTGGFEFRLSPERLLVGDRAALEAVRTSDAATFLRALDALEVGLAFFDCTGGPLHMNRSLLRALERSPEGERLRQEVQHFATSLRGLVHVRGLTQEETVEELGQWEVPTAEAHLRLKGSYIGLDLFGQGSSILVALERPAPEPLSDEALRLRFGLSQKECRVLRLLIEGKTNEEIARALFLSPHTVRHHTMHIFQKLAVHSRTEVAAKVLRG